ncbi:hypothetical protein BH10ACT9_BH10ACT9_54820 [soil metagenome]
MSEARDGAWVWCGFAALSQVTAGLIGLSVWTSTEFATDFENGTRTAGAGAVSVVATVLSIIGIFCALAAVFRPGSGARACVAGSLLLLAGCVTGLLNLPLVGHYG